MAEEKRRAIVDAQEAACGLTGLMIASIAW